MSEMTGKERMISALECKPLHGQHVPHFELAFYLTREAVGLTHATNLYYGQFQQMSKTDRELSWHDIVESYVQVAEKYNHDAILIHPNLIGNEFREEMLYRIKKRTNGKYYLTMHGDATLGIPDGVGLEKLVVELYEDPEKVKEQCEADVNKAIENAEYFMNKGLLDGYTLCSDYCFNTNPYLSPAMFDEFITPYLIKLVKAYRDMGYYVIKHTDGNIMPILDRLIEAKPHAIHSIDPQAGVDLATVKKLCGRENICVIGNVNCGLLQTGTDEEVERDVRRALHDGMESGTGYIFSTSNCVFTGMELRRYEMMHKIWREEGIYR